jgi:NADH dehydrogenase [ubiquinone] 1 alpha subcomplex assembly factor 5
MSNAMQEIFVFDRNQVRRNRTRAAKNFSAYSFLFDWSAHQLSERLMDINRHFHLTLQIGSRACIKTHPKIDKTIIMDLTPKPVSPCDSYIQASEEILPFGPATLELVLSNLSLHAVNDLPGALIQIRKSLKPDGLFLSAMLGGETLYELRQCMTEAELTLRGGISPHIAPLADKPQMGDLLQRAGFALPVVDSEIVNVSYDNIFKLMHDLRGMGEGNAIAARDKTPAQKALFLETSRLYEKKFKNADGKLNASFEIIFLIGWSPHASQQKPLTPGSAKTRLADALGASEIKAGEKALP